jgi:hypothetical protein
MSQPMEPETLTTASGAPVADNQNSRYGAAESPPAPEPVTGAPFDLHLRGETN